MNILDGNFSRIRIRGEEPEHWRDYLERILSDFPEVKEVRLVAAESVLEITAGLEHFQPRAWKTKSRAANRETTYRRREIIPIASIMAIYLEAPGAPYRMRCLKLKLRRIFPERHGKPVRFPIVAPAKNRRGPDALMQKIRERGRCLYRTV